MKKNTVSTILKLANDLRNGGYAKHADELEFKYLVLKKSEMQQYSVIKEIGQDLIDMAHPNGSHRLVGVDGDSVFETISDQKEKIEKIVKKEPVGKLSAKSAVFEIKKEAGISAKSIQQIFSKINEANELTESAIRKIERLESAGKGKRSAESFSKELSDLESQLENVEMIKEKALEDLRKIGFSDDAISTIKQDSQKLKEYNEKLLQLTQEQHNIKLKGRESYTDEDNENLARLTVEINEAKKLINLSKEESRKNIENLTPNYLKRFWKAYPKTTIGLGTSLVFSSASEIIAYCRGKIEEIKNTTNPALLRDQAQEILNQTQGWSVTHPARDGLQNLVNILTPFVNESGINDFAKLNIEQRTAIINALEKLKQLISGRTVGSVAHHVANFIPLLNIVIDVDDTMALDRQADIIVTNASALIKNLRDLNAGLDQIPKPTPNAAKSEERDTTYIIE